MLSLLLASALLSPILPCEGGTEAHEAAEKALERVAAKIGGLDPGADPKPLWTELEAVRGMPCFEGTGENGRLREPDSGLALKAWWEAGGHSWMRWYVETHAEIVTRRVVLPPDMRASLTKENAGDGELAPILCAAADETCGRETRGWVRRAQQAFRLHAFENGRARKPEHAKAIGEPRDCLAAAPEEPVARWSHWRGCTESGRDKTAALPLGRTRAPVDGWLVVRGRRGHYRFCDELRVYDLASGAAWIAQSCSGLVLSVGGSVDGAKTDAARKPATRAGRVSLDAIRETAWMTLLAPAVDGEVYEYAETADVPAGLEPAWPGPDEGLVTGGLGMGFWMTSAQTRLAVTWKRTGATPVQRKLTWPDSADAAEDHAVGLLRIADDSFVEGCPPAALPATFAAKAPAPSVGSLDAPGGVAGTQDALVHALLELAPCR